MFISNVRQSALRLTAVCAFIAGTVLASSTAFAAPIVTSSFGFGGSFTPEAGTNLGNNHKINIANSGAVIVSSADLFDLAGIVNFGSTGTLLSINGINDISAFTPISGFLTLSSGVQFNLNTLSIISRTGTTDGGSFLNLYGLGTLTAPGFTGATPASLSFTGTSSNNVLFTFAATITAPPAPPPIPTRVPEPLSLMLLGTGLVGIGALRRKSSAAKTI